MAQPISSPSGIDRFADRITPAVFSDAFPLNKVQEALAVSGRTSQRHRALPAHIVVYYVMALSLWRADSCREVPRWLMQGLRLLGLDVVLKIPVKSAISQARDRLGADVMVRLHDALVGPIAEPRTKGAWYKHWRLVSIDGSTLDVADDPALEAAFVRPGASHGQSAFPQIRFVSLVETGTHVMFATKMGPYDTSKIALTRQVLPALRNGMLALADRNFFGFDLWAAAKATGAEQLWRVKKNIRLPVEQRLPDGSYISSMYPSDKDRRHKRNGIRLRVIEYRLEGIRLSRPRDVPTLRHFQSQCHRKIGGMPSSVGHTGENPARLPGRGYRGTPGQSALALRLRDQIRVEVSPSSSSKRLA